MEKIVSEFMEDMANMLFKLAVVAALISISSAIQEANKTMKENLPAITTKVKE